MEINYSLVMKKVSRLCLLSKNYIEEENLNLNR